MRRRTLRRVDLPELFEPDDVDVPWVKEVGPLPKTAKTFDGEVKKGVGHVASV